MILRAVGILSVFLFAAGSAFLAPPTRPSPCRRTYRQTTRLARDTALGGVENQGGHVQGGESSVPRLVVMDLDDTLWRAEIEQMKGPPFNREKDGKVRDRGGKAIELFPGVREALLEVHRGGRFAGTQLAIASRTPEIRWAREVLGLIELEPGLPMERVFTYSEIYSGSKIGHFGELRRNSGVGYTDMIFFDDWDKNCNEVGSLGVTCVECRRGFNRDVWSRGLANFAAANKQPRP